MSIRSNARIMIVLMLTITTALGVAGVCSAENLLANPGFEGGVTQKLVGKAGGFKTTDFGWNYEVFEGVATVWAESAYGAGGIHTGSQALRVMSSGVECEIGAYQDVMLVANVQHTASVWVRTIGLDGPVEWAGLEVWTVSPTGDYDTLLATSRKEGSNSAYQQLTVSFSPPTAPSTVRYLVVTHLKPFYWDTWAVFDDCVLDGPRDLASITGTVISGGVGLSGATVTLGDMPPATTNSSGIYTLTGVPVTGNAASLRVTKNGYYPEARSMVVINGANSLDFDVDSVGQNILTNPGFDDGWPSNAWSIVYDGAGIVRNCAGPGRDGFPRYFESGFESTEIGSNGGSSGGGIYQTASVMPSSSYTASVWFAHFGTLWGVNPAQKAGLTVQEYDKWGTLLVDHPMVIATDFTHPAQKLTSTFTTNGQTAMVRIGGSAFLVEDYNMTAYSAVFDTFELNGAKGPGVPIVFGRVTSGGTDLAGARVENLSRTYYSDVTANTTTAEDGYYSLSIPTGLTQRIRASKDGYFAQCKWRAIQQGLNVNFDLDPIGKNVLDDAGLDDLGFSSGLWHSEIVGTSGEVRAGSTSSYYAPPAMIWYASGEEAIEILTSGGVAGGGRAYQTQDVPANTSFTASVWFRGFGPSWGIDPSQVAALFVEELKADGTVAQTHPLKYATAFDQPSKLSLSFTTTGQTAKIKVGCYAYLVDGAYVLGVDYVTWDWKSTTTGTDGKYTLPYDSGVGHRYTLFVKKDGFYSQQKTRDKVKFVTQLDYALVPKNLLVNAGFDYEGFTGWQTAATGNGFLRVGSYAANFGFPVYYRSGEESVEIGSTGAGGGKIYQVRPIVASTPYTAAVWFRGAVPLGSWGTNPTQLAQLFVNEYDAAGNLLTTHTNNATVFNQFGKITLSFTTRANAATVAVGGYAYLVDDYSATGRRAVFDSFELNGTAPTGRSLGDIKNAADGSSVQALGKIVSAAFAGFFYIENADRSAGIKVIGTAVAGSVVDVLGIIDTVGGERVINPASIQVVGSGAAIAPLGLSGRATATGLSATGLYVKVWGRVSSSGSVFTIDDGGGQSIKVYGPAGYSAVAGDFVSVVGALGSESNAPVLHAVSVTKVD